MKIIKTIPVLFVCLILMNCNEMKKIINKLEGRGMEVDKVYYSIKDAKITHGLFCFENNSEKIKEIVIANLCCKIRNNKLSIEDFFVYKLPEYAKIEDRKIILKGKEKITIEVSFSHIMAEKYLGENIAIEIEFYIEPQKKTMKMDSRYVINMRSKKRTIEKDK